MIQVACRSVFSCVLDASLGVLWRLKLLSLSRNGEVKCPANTVNMKTQRIAVIGGGPAGAMAAAELARAGREVVLFDEKLAWEKPCGGGLTDKALTRWPFLCEAQVEQNWITDCELIAPSGRTACFRLGRQIAIFSRFALNGWLLDRAR